MQRIEKRSRTKIAIVTRRLSGVMGGMEKQILDIANGLINLKFEVLIISIDGSGTAPFFDYNSNIKFISLNIGDSTKKASLYHRVLRQIRTYVILKSWKIEIAIAFMIGSFWYSVLPAKLARVPIVLAERNGPSIYELTSAKKYKKFIFLSMVFSSFIVVQFDSFKNGYPNYLREKIRVIPNRITKQVARSFSKKSEFKFVFAGRYSHQKQVVELVNAFCKFNSKFKNTKLLMFGEGELANEIMDIIKCNRMQSKIELHDPVHDLNQIFNAGDVMISPSIWEGFPNSVAESLAAGMPVAGFSDCEGLSSLIIPGVNGWLIDRKNRTDSIIELLEIVYFEKSKIESFSANSAHSVRKYQDEKIYDLWAELIFDSLP